jgi:hypothetical protein
MSPTTADPAVSAALARSILSCPASVELTVDGLAHPLEDDERMGMQDAGGVPAFLCLPGGALAGAATEGRHALLTLRSGLREASEWDVLALAGTLRSSGAEACGCCRDTRERVVVDVTFVVLARSAAERGAERRRVPLAEFRSPAHQLNAGYLQRAAEHAALCHQDELRRAVASRTGTRIAEVVGAQLTALTAGDARLEWVDTTGAHRATLPFSRTARSAEDLGDLLRAELHPGIC